MESVTPKISIIVPVFNTGDYLEKCIASIVHQTYKNLEIILIDDGSTDNSPWICDAYAKTDSRIRVVHQKNSGVAAARNKALQLVTGDYIGFVDSDDWISETMYQQMMEAVEKNNVDAAFVGYARVLENGQQVPHMYKEEGLCTKEGSIISAIGGGYSWNRMEQAVQSENLYARQGIYPI